MKLYWQAADGSGVPEGLSKETGGVGQLSWLPDGRGLAFGRQMPQSRSDIWFLRIDGGEKAEPLLSGAFNESHPQFSPDGRWLAYVADESGREEVYVRPFPALRPRWQISSGGGFHPRWVRNGRELFYFDGLKLMAVALTTTPEFRPGPPTMLFSGKYDHFDVAPDGQHFVMTEAPALDAPRRRRSGRPLRGCLAIGRGRDG
jgi:serine/threonine-protein kinase